MSGTIDLYYWPTPNGWKISIALEECGLAYQVRLIDIGAGDQFDPTFLAIAPNNRIPAIVDPDGPDSTPLALFESGAILQYLARKTGRFGGATAREQAQVEQWLMWQMGGLGPMCGQANHFLLYAPQMEPAQVLPYAQERYRREVARLLGILDRQLAQHAHVAGKDYSIADMAIWPWAVHWERMQQTLEDKPNLARWLERVGERPAVQRGRALAEGCRRQGRMDPDAQRILFGMGPDAPPRD